MAKEYEHYQISVEKKKLIKLKRDYLNSLKDESIIYSIESSNDTWFKYTNGIYIVRDEDCFNISKEKQTILSTHLLNEFVRGDLSGTRVMAVSFENQVYYFMTWINLIKTHNSYVLSHAALINEFLYNVARIKNREFSGVTDTDLSLYSKYFKVSDTPYEITNYDNILKNSINGKISNKEFEDLIQKYESEERIVKALRK